MNLLKQRTHAGPHNQRGRTIIELMIAVVIASVILLGLTTIYATTARTARSTQQLSALGEDGPLALYMMGQAVRRAGYGEIVGTDFLATDQTLFEWPHLRGCSNGQFTNAAAGNFTCVAGGNNDALWVAFQGDSVNAAPQMPSRNCAGGAPTVKQINNAASPANLANVPVISNLYQVNGGNTLVCAPDGANPQTFVNAVDEFKVFYGLDANAAAAVGGGASTMAPATTRIVTANDLAALAPALAGTPYSPWDFVVAVHICVVAKGTDGAVSAQGNSFAYRGCPTTSAEVLTGGPSKTATDGILRRTFMQVHTVRARATASPSIRP